jgi:hypothetical protein
LGDRVPGTSPLFVRQILPAVVLTAAGALVLGHLSQPGGAPSQTSLSAVPVNADAVFTSTPRVGAEEPTAHAAPRSTHRPKPVAGAAAPRKPEPAPLQQAAVGAPLQIAPSPEPPQPAASDTGLMGTLRSVGATVQEMPQRAYSRVTGWLSPNAPAQPEMPPRPPGEIPRSKAEM